MFKKAWLLTRVVGSIAGFLGALMSRFLWLHARRTRYHLFPSSRHVEGNERNIVVLGASVAGYHAARTIAESILPGSLFRVVVVEPHDHFHFTWVLPRFSVVGGHESKAFIPYGPYLRNLPAGVLKWIRGRAVRITRDSVHLSSGVEIPYEFLVVATGAGATDALPSRVGADDKLEGIAKLRCIQSKIKEAENLVVVGGGAAGVELASDAKSYYPEKTVILVHSRSNVMHRFGSELQKAAMSGLEDLGVKVITNDRLVREDKERGIAILKSGKEVHCNFLVECAGQRPNSAPIAELSPNSITGSGRVLVKSTMQICDDSLPNVYLCGDVAETNTPNPNSRSARGQAEIAADNVILAMDGHRPTKQYEPKWLEGFIKLTLGLEKSVAHIGDFSGTELLFPAKEKDVPLSSQGAWKLMGATPFQEDSKTLQRFLAES
ncbi:FAD/NAD(P)-binding domain-containing protein [Astrocystis sublimbata]|nr:FAD/NAD(P)-binding domain-containing protein [Astrocystis sublimbata]